MPQELSENYKTCFNCGTTIHNNYCPQCGQPTRTGQITFKETLNSFMSIALMLKLFFRKRYWAT